MENFRAAGRKAVIVANHSSYLDGPLLSAFLPERASFAINSHVAKTWWAKPSFALFNMIPIDPANPMALRVLVDELKKGRKVVIFPEGRLTVTGALMKVYEGPGAIAQMAKARVLPVRIDGALYTPFSRMRGKLRLRWFPKITITFLPPVKFDPPDGLRGAALRQHQADKLYDVMTDMVFRTSNIDRTLFEALLDARHTHGRGHVVLEDIQRNPATYDRLVMGSFILGRRMAEMTPGQRHVGVLLPNATGCFVTLFGLHAFGRTPAMLNFSTGAVNMAAACTAAQVTTIVTSRRFIEAGNMEEDLKVLGQNRKVIFLEDLRETLTIKDKLYGLFARFFSGTALRMAGAVRDPNAPGGDPVHLRLRRPAQGRRPLAPEPPCQPLPGGGAHRLHGIRHRVQRAADVPCLRPHGRRAAAGSGRRQNLPLSLAASLQGGAGTLLRNQCHGAVRHGHIPHGLCTECPSL